MSRWKAGQCITIEGKRYRVKKLNEFECLSCIFCDFKHREPYEYPCFECVDEVPELIPDYCYLKEIKPKS